MSGAGIAPPMPVRAGRWIAATAGLAAAWWIAGWAGATPPSTVVASGMQHSRGEPAASTVAESPAGRGRLGPRTLAPVARRRPAAGPRVAAAAAEGGLEDGSGGIRIGPGRWRPLFAAPGVGVPVEAVIDGESAAAESGDDRPLELFVLTRVHPDLPWSRIAMQPLDTDARRFQAVMPCAPCHARPEYRFEAVIPGDATMAVEHAARWPEDAAAAYRYDVGHEFVRHAAGGAVLRSAAPGSRPVGTVLTPPAEAWQGPVWSIEGVADPIFAGRWIATGRDAAGRPPRLVVAMRPGPDGPWRIVRAESPFAVGPSEAWLDLAEAVRTHLGTASRVQVAVWCEADSGGAGCGGRLLLPRMLEIRCTPPAGPDVDGDGLVGLADLMLVFEAWGPCDPSVPCMADVNGDGQVDLADVVLVVAAWGGDGST